MENFKLTPGGMGTPQPGQQPQPGMTGQGQQGQQFQINVDPKELPSIECTKCKGKIYHQMMVLKKMSAIQSPTGKVGILPVNIIVCASCLTPVAEFTQLLEK